MRKFYTYTWIILILFLLIPICNSYAQSERIAWSRLQDGKWERAHRLLQKSLRKDTASLLANYVLASWFFAPSNPDFHIDSAYRYINKSKRYYNALPVKEKERVQKFPVDSLILHNLAAKIDSAAFVRAKKENTEDSYIRFIGSFPGAIQIVNAIELRDEVSFLEALKENTYQSFHAYLLRYPQSIRAQESTERYEKLLFEDRTRNKRLAGFKSFLKEFPASPYAVEAHKQVFEISTASGDPQDFYTYLKEYPESNYQKFVQDILFHVYKEREEVIPALILTDSLKNVLALDSRFWIPFLKNNEFGFMDQTGTEVLAPQFKALREEYKCGDIRDDILALPDGYFSRTGRKIADHTSVIQTIGAGFLTVSETGCLTLIHKSGRKIIADCYEEFKMIDDNFISARKNGLLTIFTLTGKRLPLTGITAAEEAEGLILLTRSGKKVINTIRQIADMADGNAFHDELVFDEVLVVDKNLLLVRNSGLEGMINTDLKYIVPLGRHTLTKTPFGLMEKQNGRIAIHGLSAELENHTYDNISYRRNWLVLYDAGKVQLFDIPSRKLVETGADSVWFERSLTYIQKNNSQKVYLSATHSMNLQPDSKINFIPSRDSVQFFFTESKKKRTVFTLETGAQLFVTDLELVESLGSDYFVVAKGSRKGVLGRNGKPVVPVEMEAIIQTGKKQLSLLKDKKFGMYDLGSRKYFKPVYERNLISLDAKTLVVYKDGFYGLMNAEAKPITGFEFSEVQAWSDSLIWVKKNFQWILLNYFTRQVIMEGVRDFAWVKNRVEEKIVRVHRDNYYGIISNRKGILVPASFTEIINLGTVDIPFYFTEKQVEEAGIFVVVYFDKDGKLVRRQAFEEEEYDRILCDNP